jgi:hypothetical protein
MEVCLYYFSFDHVFRNLLIIQNPVVEMDNSSTFHTVYCLQHDHVDISPVALAGMRQSGLCVMSSTGFEFLHSDTYSTIDEKLRILFPKVFDWIIETEPSDEITSSWLICMKPPYRKDLLVISDDRSLPTGSDIITACQLAKSKAGVQDRILYLGKYFNLTHLTPYIWTGFFNFSNSPPCFQWHTQNMASKYCFTEASFKPRL